LSIGSIAFHLYIIGYYQIYTYLITAKGITINADITYNLTMTKQWKVSFAVTEEDYNRGKKLTRKTNVSEELRKAYGKILDKAGV
jgi:hypothetical protein